MRFPPKAPPLPPRPPTPSAARAAAAAGRPNGGGAKPESHSSEDGATDGGGRSRAAQNHGSGAQGGPQGIPNP